MHSRVAGVQTSGAKDREPIKRKIWHRASIGERSLAEGIFSVGFLVSRGVREKIKHF